MMGDLVRNRGRRSKRWEALIAMGRLADMAGDDTWKMAFIDCLSPVLRKRSRIIARDLRTDLEDVLSDMFEATLVAWADTERGCPPGSVRHRVVKSAYELAYKRAKACGGERSSDAMDDLPLLSEVSSEFTMRASGVVNFTDVRDPVVAEQIRGERFGALLRKMGYVDRMALFHQEIRDGLHPAIAQRVLKGGAATRVWVDGVERYYYVSDFYPKFMRLPEAAKVLGVAESAAYRKVRNGNFPFPVNSSGQSYQVSVGALMQYTDIPDVVIHMDDVENGAGYAE
ncbi:helix-turn-helix transcriptional regulator [Streptomyces sp. NPDC005863]